MFSTITSYLWGSSSEESAAPPADNNPAMYSKVTPATENMFVDDLSAMEISSLPSSDDEENMDIENVDMPNSDNDEEWIMIDESKQKDSGLANDGLNAKKKKLEAVKHNRKQPKFAKKKPSLLIEEQPNPGEIKKKKQSPVQKKQVPVHRKRFPDQQEVAPVEQFVGRSFASVAKTIPVPTLTPIEVPKPVQVSSPVEVTKPVESVKPMDEGVLLPFSISTPVYVDPPYGDSVTVAESVPVSRSMPVTISLPVMNSSPVVTNSIPVITNTASVTETLPVENEESLLPQENPKPMKIVKVTRKVPKEEKKKEPEAESRKVKSVRFGQSDSTLCKQNLVEEVRTVKENCIIMRHSLVGPPLPNPPTGCVLHYDEDSDDDEYYVRQPSLHTIKKIRQQLRLDNFLNTSTRNSVLAKIQEEREKKIANKKAIRRKKEEDKLRRAGVKIEDPNEYAMSMLGPQASVLERCDSENLDFVQQKLDRQAELAMLVKELEPTRKGEKLKQHHSMSRRALAKSNLAREVAAAGNGRLRRSDRLNPSLCARSNNNRKIH